MVEDRLNGVMESLCGVTNSGALVWREKSPSSKYRTHKRSLTAHGEDSTEYEMEVKYTLSDNKWEIEKSPSIWIRNKTLPNGSMYVTTYNCKSVVLIRDSVKEKYCSDMNPSIEDMEYILFDIEKGISLSTYRDNKLNQIL
jgi:hypothetical protein